MSWPGIERWRALTRLQPGSVLLLVEAMLALGMARLALALLPFRRIAAWLGQEGRETPAQVPPAQLGQARRLGWAVASMSRRTLWESKCLARAIAVRLMMRWRGIPGTLYLGVARDEGPHLVAHAWVRCGTAMICGGPGQERYTVVASFA